MMHSASKVRSTTHLLTDQRRKHSHENPTSIDGTTCPVCVWCRLDDYYYLDPPHKFLEIGDDGEQKCTGHDTVKKYKEGCISKKSIIILLVQELP